MDILVEVVVRAFAVFVLSCGCFLSSVYVFVLFLRLLCTYGCIVFALRVVFVFALCWLLAFAVFVFMVVFQVCVCSFWHHEFPIVPIVPNNWDYDRVLSLSPLKVIRFCVFAFTAGCMMKITEDA